jgi:hypothetical protein
LSSFFSEILSKKDLSNVGTSVQYKAVNIFSVQSRNWLKSMHSSLSPNAIFQSSLFFIFLSLCLSMVLYFNLTYILSLVLFIFNHLVLLFLTCFYSVYLFLNLCYFLSLRIKRWILFLSVLLHNLNIKSKRFANFIFYIQWGV